MLVLGISAFYHDSAAALVEDGRILAAAQEERFTRVRHDAGFPAHAIRACLAAAGRTAREVDRVAFYDKPLLKFERLIETYLAFAPRGFRSFRMALPVWLREKLFQKRLLREELSRVGPDADWRGKLLFAEHHVSHAASAFYPSPFESAAVLTMDGVGEWATASVAVGDGRELKILEEIHFPHSLGLLYSAFTYYTGFKVNSGEYKLMGLAPYGEPRYVQTILDHLIDLKPDGSFRLNLDYFDYCTGLTMTNARFDALLGGRPRDPAEPIERRHMDLAASIQTVTEDAVLRMTASLAQRTGRRNLCLAGGVALNCVANGKIRSFDDIWIQPAAGDAGGALGAALAACHLEEGQTRVVEPGDGMQGALLGPEYPDEEIAARLTAAGARFRMLERDALLEACAADLAAGRALGWFQGRMEFGPRALGARSILADPRNPAMQRTLNLRVKSRESFRPFAPSVVIERAAEYFELDRGSPYMLLTAPVAGLRPLTEEESALEGFDRLALVRSGIPAVTHVDGSARVQTVDAEVHPLYHALLSRFAARTGCAVLVNTSFNERGEPIVCTPEDAFACFMGTEIESLAIGSCYLRKEEQDPSLARRREFAPD